MSSSSQCSKIIIIRRIRFCKLIVEAYVVLQSFNCSHSKLKYFDQVDQVEKEHGEDYLIQQRIMLSTWMIQSMTAMR